MKTFVIGRRWPATLVLALLVALLLVPAPASAAPKGGAAASALLADDGPYGPNNRPVYFVVSLTDTFDTPLIDRVTGGVMNQADDMGSTLMLIPVGQYVAGAEIGDTRYEGADLNHIDLSNIPDPVTGELMHPEELNMNQVTILGSFCTFGGEVHMVTPDPAPIPHAVQLAFFRASSYFDQLPSPFPTTVELACFIYENQGDAGADINDILDAITATPMTLHCTTCFAEGDLFPHEPTEEPLFSFDVRFDTETGDFELDICLPITVWVKGQNGTNPFNLGSNGLLPVVVPTEPHFDAVAEVDVTALRVGTFVIDAAGIEVFVGVPIVKYAVQDQDGDGDLDLVVHFDTQEIVGLDGVDETTTELRFAGRTKLGMCIEGADKIRIVPPVK